MSGNRIDVRTLNLDGEFEKIREQLDFIAEKYFKPRKKDVNNEHPH